MGELEYHDKKVAEAHDKGVEEGRKDPGGGNGDGSLGFLLVMILFFVGIIYFNPNGNVSYRNDPPQVSQVAQTKSLPADIGNYISPDAARFYKYTGSRGEVYVRHHYEPTDQVSKQGYYRSDTNEYVLVDINYYSENDQWMCNWHIYYFDGRNRTTVASGNEPTNVLGVSSDNCQNTLSQKLADYGFDPVTYNSDGYFGDEIGRNEAFSIIGYKT